MKSTYTLDIIIETICKDDKEVDAVHNALKLALHEYQWQYQNASEKKYATAKPQADKAVAKTIELLNQAGYDELAEDVAEALYEDSDILIKSKYITKVKRLMKSLVVKTLNNDESRYKNEFAELMYQAFIEQCEKFPLDEAPRYIQEAFNNIEHDDNYPYETDK